MGSKLSGEVIQGVKTVAGIKHKKDIIVSPSADDVVREGDTLIIVGRNDSIARLENKHLEK